MKKILAVVLSAFLLFSTLCGCGNNKTENTEKLKIVTTIFPAYDFARQLAGGNAEISMLLPPGTESHNFEPTPQQLVSIQNCDLFIFNGGENEVWVESIIDSLSNVKTIKMMDCVSVIEEENAVGMEDSISDDDEIEFDEHIWTSPVNADIICRKISDTLKEIDSVHSDEYEKNYVQYSTSLLKLDGEFKDIVNNSATKTVVFADRFPARYFVEEYGLKYYAAFPGCASDTEPSSATVAFVIDKVRELDLSAVFVIEFSNRKMAETVAETTGAEIMEFHSCHNLSREDFDNGVTYIDLMRRNAEALCSALN